ASARLIFDTSQDSPRPPTWRRSMNVRYRVELSQAERDELTTMLGGGKHAARQVRRAQILLAPVAGSATAEMVRTARVSLSTVSRTKRRFVEGNLERALSEEPRPGAERK